jgi:hypothetical protein
MSDLVDYRRTKNEKRFAKDFPEGILDVIETDYPGKFFLLTEDRIQIATLFSKEEWTDILTKSRNSYRGHIQRMNLAIKHPVQENQAEIG